MQVAPELALQGIQVSSGRVRGVWGRHDLLTRDKRLLRLERTVVEQPFELSEEQIRLLERFSPEFRERHIDTQHTGELVAVDTFFVGTLKGIGKVYLQERNRLLQPLRLGPAVHQQMPVTAVHVLNTDVLPFFESHGATIDTVLSDNGR